MNIDSDDSQDYEQVEEEIKPLGYNNLGTPLMVGEVVEEKLVEHEQQQEEEDDLEEKVLAVEVAH